MQEARTRAVGLRRAFLIILVLAVSALFVAVVWPFLKPLLLAALLAALFHPFYRWVTRMLGSRRSLAAIVTLIILFILIAGPLSAFVGLVVKQAATLGDEALPWLQQHFGAAASFNAHDWLARQFPALSDYIPPQEQLVQNAGVAAKSAGGFVVSLLTRMTAGTATFVLDLFIMAYAMFFFFKDGRAMIEQMLYYVPLSRADKTRMLEQFTSITRATLKGTLLIGIIQGTLAGLGFWLAGIDGAAFWGTLMAILSILPAVGAPVVWVPAGIYLLLSGRVVTGLVLMGWCAAVLAAVEYVVRPALIGTDIKMPDLLVLVGTLGGLYLFGPIGFIVGPIVCGLFLTVWDIYGTTFRGILVPEKAVPASSEQDQTKREITA
ncbi:MAG TPA: AI-2E family transporter [Chthoniobacterales bacterium]|jgi:predicted PurR-regulated permease PerM